jgi:hypothetical protein
MAQVGGLSRSAHSILCLSILWSHPSPVSPEVPVQLGTCGLDLMSACPATITDYMKIDLCLRSYDL